MELKQKVCLGDSAVELLKLPDESVQLIYIDPPFFCPTDKKFGLKFKTIDDYAHYVFSRVALAYPKLKASGSFFLHCDYNASYLLRHHLNALFGPQNFVNEIAWCYGAGNGGAKRFNQKHDTILFYQKSDQRVWNDLFDPDTGSKLKSYWRLKSLADKSGYLAFDDEKVEYPTQKPIELIERIILCSTNPGDTVLDFFAGGGTTGVAARKNQRGFILMDNRQESIEVIERRLEIVS